MIKVISGTVGIYENNRMELKTAKSRPFALNDKREAELVAAGIAEYCGQATAPAQGTTADTPPTSFSGLPAYNTDMKLDELKAIAKAYGVDATAMKSKVQVVAAIDAAEEATAQDGEDETDEDENQLPDMNAADPV